MTVLLPWAGTVPRLSRMLPPVDGLGADWPWRTRPPAVVAPEAETKEKPDGIGLVSTVFLAGFLARLETRRVKVTRWPAVRLLGPIMLMLSSGRGQTDEPGRLDAPRC